MRRIWREREREGGRIWRECGEEYKQTETRQRERERENVID